MSFTIGIDASRNRSGGAKTHIIGIINELDTLKHNIAKVHVWSYKELITTLPNKNWLVKHSPKNVNKSILSQLSWQRFVLPKELKRLNCDIILNTDAGTICRFSPSITMSRDMLSYEKGEINRYRYGKSWLRLLLLKFMQNRSLNSANGVIFLTKYASEIIQKSCGKLENYKIIPHGVGREFKNQKILSKWPSKANKQISCLYISNTAPYKHQWKVIKAVKQLNDQGFNLKLTLAGAKGEAHGMVENAIKECNGEQFVNFLGHVKKSQLPMLLANSNVFIFASSCENLPNTLIESMCLGLPIACSDRGPMPEVLNGAGVYFDPENIQSIKKSIEKIIIDKELRKRIARKAKKKSEQYSWNRCANETMGYITKTIINTK